MQNSMSNLNDCTAPELELEMEYILQLVLVLQIFLQALIHCITASYAQVMQISAKLMKQSLFSSVSLFSSLLVLIPIQASQAAIRE